jgi:uncharacterized protein YegP (UPF0339 family)
MSEAPHIEIRKAKGDKREWYYVIVGANGEDMTTSETFTRKADAKRAAETVADSVSVGPIKLEVDA